MQRRGQIRAWQGSGPPIVFRSIYSNRIVKLSIKAVSMYNVRFVPYQPIESSYGSVYSSIPLKVSKLDKNLQILKGVGIKSTKKYRNKDPSGIV